MGIETDRTNEPMRRVELFTRPSALGTQDRLAEVIDRVRALETADHVAGCQVRTWAKRLPLDGDGDGSERSDGVYSHIDEFDAWAHEHDASLYPFFEERTRGSLAGDERSVLVLPVICLAIYEGERLEGLFPCVIDEIPYTVHDGLAALENDRPALTPTDAGSDA